MQRKWKWRLEYLSMESALEQDGINRLEGLL
jgi:hypothetical protein